VPVLGWLLLVLRNYVNMQNVTASLNDLCRSRSVAVSLVVPVALKFTVLTVSGFASIKS
jgi:hypothetical protein